MSTKRTYSPPLALSLSSLTANGQTLDQKGMCFKGGLLTSGICTPLGQDPAGGICSPNGIAPAYGYCKPTGNGAVEGCRSGGIHT